MGIFSIFKNKKETLPEPVSTATIVPKVIKPKKPKVNKKTKAAIAKELHEVTVKAKLLEKAAATERNEPWVDIIKVDIDPTNVGRGSFEIDWNEWFVAKLIKAGYTGKTDEDVVDLWFTDLCRNVALATYEQAAADPANPEHRSNRKDLGNGRTEIS